MTTPLSEQIFNLRKQANLTNRELSELADVPESLLSGLQNNKRKVGEIQGRRIGQALGLEGSELEDFIYTAVNTCSNKVLRGYMEYPAELLNMMAKQLQDAGIFANQVQGCHIQANGAMIHLQDGRTSILKTQLILS